MKGGIVISQSIQTTWQQYEAGKAYKHRVGLYETVRKNERFYRGDQWNGIHADLPHPVFNLVRRITDYLIASVMAGDVYIRYSDDALPFVDRAALRKAIESGLEAFNQNAAWRWKQSDMRSLSYQALLDAAISGDGVFYCWWDPERSDGQVFCGDIRTELVNSTDLFVADVTSSDLQSQNYVILSGRADVHSLREEAKKAGASQETINSILPDSENDTEVWNFDSQKDGDEKATYLIRFFKENGEVVFEKSTRNCLIRRVNTGLSRYPVAYFHWNHAKNSFLGNAPVSDILANQKYINSAYAMAMKHMSDTAFSKIVYDKSRIPEWSNEVGEAIAALGGGNISDAVSVVGVGEMQEGYLELIESVIEQTKSMMGATEAALGDADAANTSAILTLQNASRMALEHVRASFYHCIGEVAAIWADMLCTYYPRERLLAICDEEGRLGTARPNYTLLKKELLRATAYSDSTERYTPAMTVTVLDKLLELGHLNVQDYLSLLPGGVLGNKDAILQKISMKGEHTDE